MKIKNFIFMIMLSVAVGIGGGAANAAITNFSADVNESINKGLSYLNGQFANPATAGNAAGLVMLTLLEKRQSSDQNADATGYAGASGTDQIILDRMAAYLINSHSSAGLYHYRDGQDLMALSVYLLSGGTNEDNDNGSTVVAALNRIFDRIYASYSTRFDGKNGYFNYSSAGGADASTTQFAVAGLAAVRSVYSHSDYGDATRLADLNTMLATSRTAYANAGVSGGLVGPNGETEKGHGYHRGNRGSYHQTGAGAWILLAGGADLNDADVQKYLRWIYNRYTDAHNNASYDGWSTSHYYGMWTTSKAFAFLEDSGIEPTPATTNLSTADLGMLPSASQPAFGQRRVHRDIAAVSRPAIFGAGGAGYYSDPSEQPRWYFDYAYTLLSAQRADGYYNAGGWNWIANQSYALLVLQRSVGGGCIDTDEDGVCDADDNCPATHNPADADGNQADADGDGVGDACDVCPGSDDNVDTDNDGVADGCDACPGHDDSVDSDGDLVPDGCDNCPDLANDQVNADGDAWGDACDECPDLDGDADPDPTRPGCPNNQPPVAICQDIVVSADANCQAEADVNNGSFDPDDDAITITADPAGPYGLGATTVILTVTDGLETVTCQATVTVNDTTPPVLVGVPTDATVECDNVPAAADVTATDNCSVGVPDFDEVRENGNCPNNYTLTRTWTVTDGSDNTTTETQVLIVQDTSAPTFVEALPADTTVECDSVPAMAVLTATDNCDLAPAVTSGEERTDGTCADSYTLTRTWTTTDVCGNSTSHTQTITVQDTTVPVVTATLVPVKVKKKHGCFRVEFSATDNCDDEADLSAELNGHPVTNGELVRLHYKKHNKKGCRVKIDGDSGSKSHDDDSGSKSHDDDGSSADCGTVKFECNTFVLTVTATDNCGNENTETAEHVFADGNSHDDDSSSGHKKKKDHGSDDDSSSGHKKKGKKK